MTWKADHPNKWNVSSKVHARQRPEWLINFRKSIMRSQQNLGLHRKQAVILNMTGFFVHVSDVISIANQNPQNGLYELEGSKNLA